MTDPRVIAVRSAELGVPSLKTASRFYQDVWGLAPVAAEGPAQYLRATGPEHHIIRLEERARPELIRVNFAAADKAAVDALYARAQAKGVEIVAAPAAMGGPAGGYGFTFRSKNGVDFSISCDVPAHGDAEDANDRPRKISHVVLNSTDVGVDDAFFMDTLGFRLSDDSGPMHFFRCMADHHSVAIARSKYNGLNHIAYEVPDIYALMRGVGRLKRKGFEMGWGVGRHGPGNNIFGYWVEPSGFVIEYTTEVQQIDEEDYTPGTPEDWKAYWQSIGMGRGGPNCRWGLATTQTEQFHRAMAGEIHPYEWNPDA